MAQDFTLEKYRQLLEAFQKSGYAVFSVQGFLINPEPPPPFVILRHDVDRLEKRALAMAKMEKELGCQSTYYFRVGPSLTPSKVLPEVAALGHEVGYHYEVLSKARGDREKARQLFGEELTSLRKMTMVRTASMHGSPLSRWSNLLFWETHNLAEFDLVGEAYLSFLPFSSLAYVSDTGRCWNSRTANLRDWFPSGGPTMPGPFFTTDDLLRKIEEKLYPRIYLLAHPNRWTSSWGAWVFQWGEDIAANWLKKRLRNSLAFWKIS